MAAPEASTLQRFCLGIQLADVCEGGGTPTGPVTLQVHLRPPAGAGGGSVGLRDPSNNAVIPSGLIHNVTVTTAEDGAIVTCPLPPTSAADPDDAIQPSGARYDIVLKVNKRTVFTTIGFDLNLEDAVAATEVDFSGDDCLDLVELVPPVATVPASDAFGDAVRDSLDRVMLDKGNYANLAAAATATGLPGTPVPADETWLITTPTGLALARPAATAFTLAAAPVSGTEIGHGDTLPADDSEYGFFEIDDSADPVNEPNGLYRWDDDTSAWVQL